MADHNVGSDEEWIADDAASPTPTPTFGSNADMFAAPSAPPAAADDDMSELSVQVDSYLATLKSSILSAVSDLKVAVHLHEKSERDSMRKNLQAEMNMLRSDGIRLRETLGRQQEKIEVLDTRCERYDGYTHKLRNRIMLEKLFAGWRMWAAEQKKRAQLRHLTAKHSRRSLLKNMFSTWQASAAELKNARADEIQKSRLDIAVTKMSQEYEEQIGALKKQLSDANAEIEAQNKHRARLEENLKKAFMRGVCALNMEAMTILRENAISTDRVVMADQNAIVRDPVAELTTAQIEAALSTTVPQAGSQPGDVRRQRPSTVSVSQQPGVASTRMAPKPALVPSASRADSTQSLSSARVVRHR
jgi:centrosomal protein POC5